ncbi:MAG: hypothetical protein HY727_15640 [Candidatus Rokubacteria bacterium]|nr:hypothetical protein [Candidatus Rokubacteria bacterium]
MALAVGLTTGPALAGQCPLLIKQLNEAVGNRVDAAAGKAKDLIAEAQQLHDDGVKMKDAKKHADSVAKCDEAAKMLGVALKKK